MPTTCKPQIISRRERVTEVTYSRVFQDTLDYGSSLAFDCDERGNLDMKALSSFAYDNLLAAFTDDRYSYVGIEQNEHSYTRPAVLRCSCGAEIELSSFNGNDCERCGEIYNEDGQAMAPRSQWGAETGESYSDIVSGHDPESFGYPYDELDF